MHAQQREKDSIRLFYLGGQSNMDGYGYNIDLPNPLEIPLENVYIFHGNSEGDDKINGGLGTWEMLKKGHGTGFSSNGLVNNLSDRFGVELSFANKLKALYPNEKIAIIKYSRGGTSIDSLCARQYGCWEPDYKGTTGVNQYDHFLTTIKNALSIKDIDKDGKEDVLIPSGIIWMQGESDAECVQGAAERYYYNLKRLMDLMRASFHKDDLPVVLGKISDSGKNENGKIWKYGELIQFAQEEYVRKDGNAAIVRDTKYYQHSDPWHYNSEGYLDLGKKFAEAIHQLTIKQK